jgi:formylglycine-generating enzyme required for sulfatase activity
MITRTIGGSMMRRLSLVLLVLLAFWAGCQDGSPNDKNVPPEKPFTTDDPDMKEVIWKKDGAKMVLIPEVLEVTPSTREIIPTTYDKFGDVVREEHEIVTPEKTVKVFDAFYMDVYEVTVGQFKKFLKSSGYEPDEPINWTSVYKYSPTEKHPMIDVDWHDATAYAKWAGKRLPYEKEWAWAARGGLKNKKYSWGDDKSLARDYANYDGTGGNDKWKYTAPVGSFRPNGYGLYDMAGNVYEWCQDWYSSSERQYRVLRGGSWLSNTYDLRGAYRGNNAPDSRHYYYGFRCVLGFP